MMQSMGGAGGGAPGGGGMPGESSSPLFLERQRGRVETRTSEPTFLCSCVGRHGFDDEDDGWDGRRSIDLEEELGRGAVTVESREGEEEREGRGEEGKEKRAPSRRFLCSVSFRFWFRFRFS